MNFPTAQAPADRHVSYGGGAQLVAAHKRRERQASNGGDAQTPAPPIDWVPARMGTAARLTQTSLPLIVGPTRTAKPHTATAARDPLAATQASPAQRCAITASVAAFSNPTALRASVRRRCLDGVRQTRSLPKLVTHARSAPAATHYHRTNDRRAATRHAAVGLNFCAPMVSCKRQWTTGRRHRRAAAHGIYGKPTIERATAHTNRPFRPATYRPASYGTAKGVTKR